MPYYCLGALPFVVVANCYDRSFWEIVHLLFATGGFTWLLLKRQRVLASLPARQARVGVTVLVALSLLFALTGCITTPEPRLPFLLSIVLVVVVFAGSLFVGPEPRRFSRAEKGILGGGAAATLLSLGTQFVADPALGQDPFTRWLEPLRLLVMALLCFAVVRLLREETGKAWGIRLLASAAIAFGIVSVVGLWRIGAACYRYSEILRSFRDGQYEQVRREVSRFTSADPDLRFEFLSLESALQDLVDSAAREPGNTSAFALVGDLANQYHYGEVAYNAYREVLRLDPAYPAIHARIGNSLFEQGLYPEASAAYKVGTEQSRATTEDFLALGVALARMEDWEGADKALHQAGVLADLNSRLTVLLPPGRDLASVRLDQLLPPEAFSYLGQLSLYRLVRLLQRRGWEVLHPGMQIGDTRTHTPVDIAAVSGGGSTFLQERLWVDGKDVSPHKRGYNVAVIDPRTGAVEFAGNFDTWMYPSESNRLAGFLRNLPDGKIVAATVSDEASASLVGSARYAMQDLGVRFFPKSWWSHAFIAVKGAGSRSASEALAFQNFFASTGVLKANLPEEAIGSPTRIESLLREAAASAPGKIALFVPALDPAAVVTIARQ
jgi:tetratricopeptide (TPR) repeat protein